MRGAIVVGRIAVNEFFIGLVGEDIKREAIVRFPEEGADAIFGEAGAVAVEGNLVLLFGGSVLVGEPGFDVVASERRVKVGIPTGVPAGFRVQGRGRRGRGRGGEGARGR